MSLKVTQIATLVAAAAITLSANAASTFGSHGAVTSGTASDGMTVSGTITQIVAPQWERANATSGLTANAATTDNLSADKKQVTVAIPSAGSTTAGHTALSVRTVAGFREMGTGSGVQIDVMNGTNPASFENRIKASTNAMSEALAKLPLKVGGATVGEALVPIRYGAIYQYGADGSSAQRVKMCTSGGSLITGNLLPETSAEDGNGTTTLRNNWAEAGLRSVSEAIIAVRSTPGSTNTATTDSSPTADAAGACAKPAASGTTSHLVDHAVFVRPTDMVLRFTNPVTSTTSYSIPLSFRVTYI